MTELTSSKSSALLTNYQRKATEVQSVCTSVLVCVCVCMAFALSGWCYLAALLFHVKQLCRIFLVEKTREREREKSDSC